LETEKWGMQIHQNKKARGRRVGARGLQDFGENVSSRAGFAIVLLFFEIQWQRLFNLLWHWQLIHESPNPSAAESFSWASTPQQPIGIVLSFG